MHSASLVLGLMVGAVTSRTFKYALPANVEAMAGCIFPGEFEVSDFTTYTDFLDSTKNTTSFHYSDVDTGIDTSCQHNSTSTPISSGAAQRWACDNANVEFIYQTTSGVAGLTILEKACLQRPQLHEHNFNLDMYWQAVAFAWRLHEYLAFTIGPPRPRSRFGGEKGMAFNVAPKDEIAKDFGCWTLSCGYIAVDHGESTGPDATVHMGQERSTHNQNGGAIVVAFRGTYSITNTVIDLSTIPQEYVPYPSPEDGGDTPPREPEHKCTNCTVHMGFLSSWKIARDDVLPHLKQLHQQYPEYPLYLIGHSLGGAVAALAALELKVIFGWDNIVVTTFGEPRVGNEGFVKYLDTVFELVDGHKQIEKQTYRRITHVDDPVPLLPLSEWGYRSHAGEVFISKSELPPEPSDIRPCAGDRDPNCIAGSEDEALWMARRMIAAKNQHRDDSIFERRSWGIPARLKLWQLFFAHRDYFWRLGLCIPGGDPFDWGRDGYDDPRLSNEL
ncbi:hypothetical protein SLS62_002753 [Diatrype stigma]|uniref:Fungal lipase-type domain-containing protein n=1 Tax=Diatrype stigma TaxID=117547 RepID=A0AAN9UVZ5_9PEZI